MQEAVNLNLVMVDQLARVVIAELIKAAVWALTFAVAFRFVVFPRG